MLADSICPSLFSLTEIAHAKLLFLLLLPPFLMRNIVFGECEPPRHSFAFPRCWWRLFSLRLAGCMLIAILASATFFTSDGKRFDGLVNIKNSFPVVRRKIQR